MCVPYFLFLGSFSRISLRFKVGSITSQQTFQRFFNVVFWLMRRRDVGQYQITVETTLCISTLEFTTSNNVESMLCISTLIWTTLDNLETTLSFSALIWTTLANVETTLWKWPFLKRKRQIISKRIYGVRSFNYFFVCFFTLLPMLVESIEEYLLGRENSLNVMKDTALLELNLNCFTL